CLGKTIDTIPNNHSPVTEDRAPCGRGGLHREPTPIIGTMTRKNPISGQRRLFRLFRGRPMVNAGTILGLAMFALGLVIGSTATAQAQKKVALLIGNNRYQHVPALKTAINDAHSLAEVLRKLGFSVIVAENQSRRAMSEALLIFDKAVE